jgi:hypothetical protein
MNNRRKLVIALGAEGFGTSALPFSSGRRGVLRAMLAGGTLALTGRRAVAQSGASLYGLPRQALIIGNSSYRDAPLQNPANDARAIAEELKGIGFEVAVHLDAGRDAMLKAIDGYGDQLAKRGSVGLFYFAGHGAQLAWRNYLIPVDAVIDTLDDVRTGAVELNLLLQGLTRAKNPMNVIILDACRDNPFGKRVPVEQRGLSQFDAPPGSLLAYATSPGNVASDGDGANGLFTENLLRELKVPEAKIEDVFKRVRLAVRRRSNGQQIPWESTSLEEDFYFRPPKELRAVADAEARRLFEEDLAIWEKIKEAKDPVPFEDYLRKYPSGRYAELAQFQLDRVLARLGEQKIEVVSAPDNPFTKGTIRISTNFRIGDSYSYRVTDLYTKLELRKITNRVTEITENEVIFNGGESVTDLLGNPVKRRDGARYYGAQMAIPEYSVGKKWITKYRFVSERGQVADTDYELKVIAKEKVVVPAGVFDAFQVEGRGWNKPVTGGGGTNLQFRSWIAPGIGRPIANETLRRNLLGGVLVSERAEMTSYSQG